MYVSARSENGGEFHTYDIVFSPLTANNIRVVHKGSARFSDLLKAHTLATERFPDLTSDCVFPPKKLIGSRTAQTVMERTAALKSYFQGVSHHQALAEFWFHQSLFVVMFDVQDRPNLTDHQLPQLLWRSAGSFLTHGIYIGRFIYNLHQ